MGPGKALLLSASLLAGAAHAASDKVAIAPAPSWVKPVAIPVTTKADEEAPVQVLLADQQSRLEPGRVSNYVDLAVRIQTPQGLSAGNLSFPWDPETDDITVHKLVIHRGDELIDVLAGGQTFTVVRREPNLESATLDGMLTANIQPEGLQVGDILEYAVTMSSSDPVLKGHVEQGGANWNGVAFARAHLSVQWPSSMPVRLRQNGALPALKPVTSGGTTRVELSMDNVEPAIPPRYAPNRFALGRIVEFSDFKSWAELGAIMAPLYADAAVIPAEGPLRNEVEKIKAASADPVKRAEAALTLVQDRVRYVALLMGTGGYVPASAAESWARRYGDCKAKTALMLAILHELGIEADPVAVNAISGDGIDERLPMIGLFNHVIVRANVGGKTYWLDGTRTGDTSLARLRTPYFTWGLPLIAQNAALVRMVPDPLDKPEKEILIDIDASKGFSIPAPTKATMILRNDSALGTRIGLAQLTTAQRDEVLRRLWKDQFDDLEVTSATARYDEATGEEIISAEGTADVAWDNGWYYPTRVGLAYEPDFARTDGPNHDAPYANDYPDYLFTRFTVKLPPGFQTNQDFATQAVDETVAGTSYVRTVGIADNVYTVEATTRALAPEFAAKDAPSAEKAMKAISDKRVALRRPNNLPLTNAEMETEVGQEPKDAAGVIRKARYLYQLDRRDEATATIDAALKRDPDDVQMRVQAAGYFFGYGERDRARALVKDLDVASVTDPATAAMLGAIAMADTDYQRAVAAFTTYIKANPTQPQGFGYRAEAHWSQGDYDAALADVDAALKLDPSQTQYRFQRANVLRMQGKMDAAMAEVAAISDAHPDDAAIQATVGRTYISYGKNAEAFDALSRSLAIKPDGTTYANRFVVRPYEDLDGKLADIDAALKMNKDSSYLLYQRADLLRQMGKGDDALADADKRVAEKPQDAPALTSAASVYYLLGESQKAFDTIDKAIALKPSAMLYITRADFHPWRDFAGREADLDAALKLEPSNDAGLVRKAYLQMDKGDPAAAARTLTPLIERTPGYTGVIGARGIAYAKAGDTARAEADFALARSQAHDYSMLNSLCYDKAKSGVALARALEECNASLAMVPGTQAVMDSKAFVLLRMGQVDDAIALFDKVLEESPNLTASRYGRAIALARKGDMAKAEADRAVALKLDPKVEETFASYGVTMK